MRRTACMAGLTVLLLVVASCCIENSEVAPAAENLSGPYFGQPPPGEVPEIFAPAYLPDIGYEHTATMFTRDGTEAFWGRVINPQQSPRVHVIMHARQADGEWLEPELAPFNVGINSFIDSVSPDGKRVYFQAYERTEVDRQIERRWTNWVAEKGDAGWGEPRLLESEFDWPDKFFDYQVVKSGNRYFTSTLEGAGREIGFFVSRLRDGSYEDPQPLAATINSEHLDYAFYVDHDEDFILFVSDRPAEFEGNGLYVSFRGADGSWGPARGLDSINRHFGGGVSWPYLSSDKNYLFFISSVDAFEDSDVERGTYSELKAIAQSPENGYLRIYWTSASCIERLR